MLSVDIGGFGVVRQPGTSPHPIYFISISQPQQSWTVYRRPAAFRALSDRLQDLLPGMQPCPPIRNDGGDLTPEYLNNCRQQLQAWLQHVRLYPAVKDAAAFRSFILEQANIQPPYLEALWGGQKSGDGMAHGGVASRGGGGVSGGATGGGGQHHHAGSSHNGRGVYDEDDMEMDDLFQGRHTEKDVAEDDDVALAHATDDENFEDEEDDDHENSMEMFQKSAAGAETVFYNSDIEEEDDDDGPREMRISHGSSVGVTAASVGASSGGGNETDRFFASYTTSDNNRGGGVGGGVGGGNLYQTAMKRAAAAAQGGGQRGMFVGSLGGALGGGGGMVMATTTVVNASMEEGKSSQGAGCGSCKKRASLDSFKILKVIGKGSFGKVFLVREKNAGKIYAMKVLNKNNIIKRNQVEHTRTERNVLGYIKHPFIVGLNMAFQTKDKLFFVLDYCAGGELFFHLGKLGKFSEPRASFYSAEITLALEHVHKLDIIYRDLKPENVLLDARGHIRLTDFGLSKEGISDNTSGAHSFCGTPEYLAPEILNRQGHGRAVDWWSLGALQYEMLTGLPPFYCRDREKLFEKIRSADLTFPKFVSEPARSVLTGLLTRDPNKRLGSGETDAEEVKSHPFFAEINWDYLMKGAVPPPWEPTVCGSLDTSQFDKEFTSMPIFSPDGKDGVGRFGVSQTDDTTFAGFTFTDDSMQMMQAGMQQLRGHHA